MKKTTNFDAFAQFADAQLSKEEMKNIKGGAEWEGGDPGTGGGDPGTGGGTSPDQSYSCYGGYCGTPNSISGRGHLVYADNWADAAMQCQTYWTDRSGGSLCGYIGG